jgi:hypothetical protein
MKKALRLSAHDIRRISVEAQRDPRTVAKAIAGEATPLATLSVRQAAARLGITLPVPAE